MSYQDTFKRYEIKYLISAEQKKALLKAMEPYMVSDAYGRSTICNIYYDTKDKLLIRRSLEKPLYKEKLRVRSYGTAKPDGTVFVEIKKKYDSVVYKRRIGVEEKAAMAYLNGGVALRNTDQITEEIKYFCKLYQDLEPAVYLSYEREAFYGKEDENLRITFDENILWREEDISLCSKVYGAPLLEKGQVLMEIKVAAAMPLWLARLLSEQKIFQTSFSKYGTAYAQMQQLKKEQSEEQLGGRKYA